MALLAQEVADFAGKSGREVAVGLVVTALAATLTFLLGRSWGRYKARREWARRESLDRVLVSLNAFHEGTLKIRTVFEKGLAEVFLNALAAEKVLAAARLCTAENPVLPVPPADRWYLLNYALNAVAEQFSAGLIRMDAGLPLTTVKYCLFLTCEVVGPERIRKVRVMMVQEHYLRDFPYPAELPKLENPWHAARVQTLRFAAALYAREPDHFIAFEVYA